MGAVANVVGIIGSLAGGFVMSLIGKTGVDGFNLGSLLVAVGGSVLLLAYSAGSDENNFAFCPDGTKRP